jgi:hypothetical protein
VEGHRHVGQRSERDQLDLAGVAPRRLEQGVYGVPGVRLAPVQGQAHVAHAVLAVDELGGHERGEQRGLRAAEHGGTLPEQFQGVEGVLDALVDRNVAGHDRDRLDPDARVPQGHHQRDRVVGSSVGVYQ